MVSSFCFCKSSGSCLLYKLKLFEGLCRKACEKTITAINPAGEKGMSDFFKIMVSRDASMFGYVFEMVKS